LINKVVQRGAPADAECNLGQSRPPSTIVWNWIASVPPSKPWHRRPVGHREWKRPTASDGPRPELSHQSGFLAPFCRV